VDRYTAYADLTALGFPRPAGAQQWARRPPAIPRRRAAPADPAQREPCIIVDGRLFLVAGYPSGGASYGMFEDEMEHTTVAPEDLGT
jgi:hypothetical protein